MRSFQIVTSKVIPLPHRDIDTDQIIPAAYLKTTGKDGLAEGLFAGWRYLDDGEPDPDFPLNQAVYQHAQVLLTGGNFGCGSSREHAPWALTAWGIRAVISTSFADIFRSNALKNGLLPVLVEDAILDRLITEARARPPVEVIIDLPAQQLHLSGGDQILFPIDAFSKRCLVEGNDPLGYLIDQLPATTAFEAQRSASPQGKYTTRRSSR